MKKQQNLLIFGLSARLPLFPFNMQRNIENLTFMHRASSYNMHINQQDAQKFLWLDFILY